MLCALCLVLVAPLAVALDGAERQLCEASGWRAGPAAPSSCDLRRVHADDAALREPASLTAPVIIEGALSGWGALSSWPAKAEFASRHGRAPVRRTSLVNASLDIAQDGVNTKPDSDSQLRHLLDSLGDEGAPPLLLFEAAPASVSLVRELAADLGGGALGSVPALEHLAYPTHVVSIGGPSRGLPPHKHQAAWLGVVVGRKKWSFLPPDALSGDASLYHATALQSPSRWSEAHRARLRRDAGLLECVQAAGEVVLLPSLWWHGTENLGDVVAVGRQSDDLSEGLPRPTAAQRTGCATYHGFLAGLPLEARRRGAPPDGWEALPASELLRRAWEMEPLSIHHVLALAGSLLTSAEPAAALELVSGRASAAEKQVRRGHLAAEDAHQFVGRLGMWLDALRKRPAEDVFPALAGLGGEARRALQSGFDASLAKMHSVYGRLGNWQASTRR